MAFLHDRNQRTTLRKWQTNFRSNSVQRRGAGHVYGKLSGCGRVVCRSGAIAVACLLMGAHAFAQSEAKIASKQYQTSGEIRVAQAAGGVRVSNGAILCQSLGNAKIILELAKLGQEHKAKGLDGCWAAVRGKEVLQLGVYQEFVLVAPLDELNSKGWAYSGWFTAK